MRDIQRASLVGELLRAGLAVRFRADGGSMLPGIVPGDRLLVEPVVPDGLDRDDVVLYQIGGRLIAHRIVSEHRGAEGTRRLVVRGDNLRACDRPVDEAMVIGRVSSVEPSGLSLLRRARTAVASMIRRAERSLVGS